MKTGTENILFSISFALPLQTTIYMSFAWHFPSSIGQRISIVFLRIRIVAISVSEKKIDSFYNGTGKIIGRMRLLKGMKERKSLL